MPLDVDRVAAALLDGAKALIAKAVAPLRAENADLKALIESLSVRVMALEGQVVLVLATERTMTDAEIRALANDWLEVCEKAEAAKAHADDVRAAIPPPPDLSGLATKAEIEEIAATAATAAVRAALPDLSGLATKDDLAEVRRAIPTLPDPPDLSGMATRDALSAAIAALPAQPDLSGFATKAEVGAAVATIHVPEPLAGRVGTGIAEMRQNDDGELIVKLTTGDTINAGRVRGADGLGFDDLAVEYDGERTIALVFTKGERVEREEIVLPIPVDRGVWKEGETYQRGDCVTWGGNLSIAQRETTAKPERSDDWRLAVRAGRNGKPGSVPAPRPETVKR